MLANHERVGDIVTTDPGTEENVEIYNHFGAGALPQVPHHSEAGWEFLLAVYDRQPRRWRRDEIDMLRELSSRLWLRLENVRAGEALQASQDRLLRALQAAKMVAWEWDCDLQQLVTLHFPRRAVGHPPVLAGPEKG